jgi:hypothetical protein
MTDLTTDEIARRLRRLELSEPDPAQVTRWVLARAHRRSHVIRWRVTGALALATLLFIALNAIAAIYVPRFAQALADVPVASTFLQQAGLATVSHRISAFGDVSEVAGVRVELVAGYADSARTVLLLRQSPNGRIVAEGGSVRLRDQFGNDYPISGSVANTETGEVSITFAPLRWPASATGARLDLRIARLEVGPAGQSTPRAGPWRLGGTIALDEGSDLRLPEPRQLGNLHLAFTGLRALPGGLAVRIQVDGVSSGELSRSVPDGQKGRPAFQLQLIDSLGAVARLQSMDLRGAGTQTDVDAIWLFDARDAYRLVISYDGSGSVDIPLNLPAADRGR